MHFTLIVTENAINLQSSLPVLYFSSKLEKRLLQRVLRQQQTNYNLTSA